MRVFPCLSNTDELVKRPYRCRRNTINERITKQNRRLSRHSAKLTNTGKRFGVTLYGAAFTRLMENKQSFCPATSDYSCKTGQLGEWHLFLFGAIIMINTRIDVGIMPPGAIGAYSMTEFGIHTATYIVFHPVPVPLIVPDALTVGTDGQQPL